jgi:CHASE2 domain-containing sensor protein
MVKIWNLIRQSTLAKNIIITVFAFAMLGFITLIAVSVKPLNPLAMAVKNFSFTDIYYSILEETADPDTSMAVTIVDMTQLYRRGQLAQVLEDIQSCDPKAVGVDVAFDVEKDDFAGNDSLIALAAQYPNMVFALKLLDYTDENVGFTTQIHSFLKKYVDFKEGFVNVPRGGQYDGMKRVIPLQVKSNGEYVPSMVTQAVSLYVGDESWKKEGKNDVDINFCPKKFRILQSDEVLDHPELIKDRIVLFGAMYDDSDFHWTPVGKIPGVMLLAYGIQTLLERNEVKTLPSLPLFIISFCLTLLIFSFQMKYRGYMGSSSNLFVRFVIGSTYVVNILTFLFTSVFLGICFLVFYFTQVNINLGWTLASLPFLFTSRNLYEAIVSYIDAKIADSR